MNIDRRIIGVCVAAAACAGCTPTDVTLGNAVRQTMAAQVVNPDPEYDNPVPAADGAKGAAAVNRYRSDTVKKPDKVKTTEATSGGSPR